MGKHYIFQLPNDMGDKISRSNFVCNFRKTFSGFRIEPVKAMSENQGFKVIGSNAAVAVAWWLQSHGYNPQITMVTEQSMTIETLGYLS